MAILCGVGQSGEAPTTHLNSPPPSTGASISIMAITDRPSRANIAAYAPSFVGHFSWLRSTWAPDRRAASRAIHPAPAIWRRSAPRRRSGWFCSIARTARRRGAVDGDWQRRGAHGRDDRFSAASCCRSWRHCTKIEFSLSGEIYLKSWVVWYYVRCDYLGTDRVILAVPLAIGVGLDVFDLAGDPPGRHAKAVRSRMATIRC